MHGTMAALVAPSLSELPSNRQCRRKGSPRPFLTIVTLLIPFLASLLWLPSRIDAVGSHVKHRRCFQELFGDGDDEKSSITRLHESQCLPCSPQKIRVQRGFNPSTGNGSVVMFVIAPWMNVFGTASDVTHPMLSLIVSVLLRYHSVWVLHLEDPSCNPHRRDFTRKLLSSLPCDLQLIPKQTLSVYTQPVVGLDLCKGMDEEGQSKAQGWNDHVELEAFDATDRIVPVLQAMMRVEAFKHTLPKIVVVSEHDAGLPMCAVAYASVPVSTRSIVSVG